MLFNTVLLKDREFGIEIEEWRLLKDRHREELEDKIERKRRERERSPTGHKPGSYRT